MRKRIRIIITFAIIVIILLIYSYRQMIMKEYSARKELSKERLIEVQIVDKYNKINKLYENPEAEE